jgi:serine protease AprX
VLPFVAAGAPAATAGNPHTALMTAKLADAISEKPSALYDVIVTGRDGRTPGSMRAAVSAAADQDPGGRVRARYHVISAMAATMSGAAIQALANNPAIATITPDAPVRSTSTGPRSQQLWPDVAQVSSLSNSVSTEPTIAVVDSGVDATRVDDFGARVVAQTSFVPSNRPNAEGTDGFGHGTFVASIAAGEAAGYEGAAPGANIVSLDVLDDTGAGVESDVLAAADWIYENGATYDIRVANFSLLAGSGASFMYDPLDQAVEKLWLSGVVVVTAVGNYASDGQASGVPYAPANDPFVITVGAADVNGTVSADDDFNAPWSAYGYTLDGFLKPELGAPGRYMDGAVPTDAAMYVEHPERVVAPGYLWMSGTSFAAPVVAGAAGDLLALNPSWTPDDVKGALMLSAAPTSAGAGGYALGVGEVQAAAAAEVVDPPNPNAALEQYVVSDSNGSPTFDAASWSSAAQANASWSSASWSSASWSSASWSSASWSSASWSSGETSDGALPVASWSSLSWVD